MLTKPHWLPVRPLRRTPSLAPAIKSALADAYLTTISALWAVLTSDNLTLFKKAVEGGPKYKQARYVLLYIEVFSMPNLCGCV